jgi:hypothetical protein
MAQDIVGLTLLEAQELKTILKDEWHRTSRRWRCYDGWPC